MKAFATKMAPTLHEHLSMGESMDKAAEMNTRAQRSSTTRGTGTSGSGGPMPTTPGTGTDSGPRGGAAPGTR